MSISIQGFELRTSRWQTIAECRFTLRKVAKLNHSDLPRVWKSVKVVRLKTTQEMSIANQKAPRLVCGKSRDPEYGVTSRLSGTRIALVCFSFHIRFAQNQAHHEMVISSLQAASITSVSATHNKKLIFSPADIFNMTIRIQFMSQLS